MDELKLKGKGYRVRNNSIYMILEEDGQVGRSLFLCLTRTGACQEIPIKIRRKKIRGKQRFLCRLDAKGMECGYYELGAEICENGEKKKVPVRILNKWMQIRQVLLPVWVHDQKTGSVLYPYINAGSRCMFLYRPYKPAYDTKRFLLKDALALVVYFLLKLWLDRKKIWLVGEKNGRMAQENGYYFFKYCMENLPEKERKRIYYVIANDSADKERLEPYKPQVIDFMSFRYLVMLHAADLLISTDTGMMFYEMDTINTAAKILYRKRKPNVFLQHGVMGLKQCHEIFHKKKNRCSLFVTSSETEKEIIKKYFGYNDDEIVVTGLPRWDAVEDHSDPCRREILLMPTWRRWLDNIDDAAFTQSEYFRHYQALLENEKMEALLEKRDLRMIFYVHPNFRDYQNLFKGSGRIRPVFFGEEPLNELMMRCSLMITDYSSACWDVFRQKKPVVFDLFDRDMYEKYTGAYMDLENGLFGDRADTPEDLIRILENYADRDFREKEEYGAMRKDLLPMIDRENSRRIYEEIVSRKFESGLTAQLIGKVSRKLSIGSGKRK